MLALPSVFRSCCEPQIYSIIGNNYKDSDKPSEVHEGTVSKFRNSINMLRHEQGYSQKRGSARVSRSGEISEADVRNTGFILTSGIHALFAVRNCLKSRVGLSELYYLPV